MYLCKLIRSKLKVRLSQNEYIKSLIFQNMNRKIWRISAQEYIGQKSFKNFGSYFGKLMISYIHSDLIWPLGGLVNYLSTLISVFLYLSCLILPLTLDNPIFLWYWTLSRLNVIIKKCTWVQMCAQSKVMIFKLAVRLPDERSF